MVGIISDDLTGCGDVGIHFAKSGLRTIVFSCGVESIPRMEAMSLACDVLIVDTETRLDTAESAYEKVRKVVHCFRQLNIVKTYKKIDSTLRGNIGSEIDALFDEFPIENLPFCAAFPEEGRTTLGGYHYVRGKLLTETEFAEDRLTPVVEAHIPTLLKMTCRHYARVTIYDAETPDDLRNVAEKVADCPVVCGASSLAGELVKLWVGKRKCPDAGKVYGEKGGPVLIISGSLKSATYEQIEELRKKRDLVVVPIDFTQEKVEIPLIKESRHILIYPCMDAPPGRRQRVIHVLVRLAKALCTGNLFHNLILIGGDTAYQICKALGICVFEVVSPVMPGVAFCRTLDGNYKFILKPGALGGKEALLNCFQFFEEQEQSV